MLAQIMPKKSFQGTILLTEFEQILDQQVRTPAGINDDWWLC
jgi:hypothetical protein